MVEKSGYKVNEDGSVTKIKSNNKKGSSDGNGCIWFIIFAVLIGFLVYTFFNNNNSGSTVPTDVVDSVVAEGDDNFENNYIADTVEADVYTPSTTYLSVSEDDIYMDAEGGSTEISVSSDGEWCIDVGVTDWGHLTKYSNSIILRLDKNQSNETRTDYFVLKSGNHSKRINITQFGNTSPEANIESIWMDHGVNQNGIQGMRIHVKFTVDHMKGKTIYVYAFFYWGDNTTPLHDQYGNNLSFHGYGTPSYDSARFDDFVIFVPYTGMNMQPGQGTVSLSFDISVRTSDGTQLDRNNNTQITFSN